MRGAGGTSGFIAQFFIGVVMFIVGLYLFLSNITVTNQFSLRTAMLSFGTVDIVSGILLIPLMFGIGFVFYNRKSLIGWILIIASLGLLIVGIIASLRFIFKPMNVFSLMIILVLTFGGLGLFLSSLREKK